MKKTLLAIVLFSIISMSVFSQAAALVLNYFEIKDEKVQTDTQEQIKEHLEEELQRQSLEYLDETFVASEIRNRNLSGRMYLDQINALDLGRIAEVPIVITVEAVEREAFLEIIVTAWDVEAGRQIISDRKVANSEVSRYIMINAAITQVVQNLTGDYGIEVVEEDPKVRKITFLSNLEGMKIYMPDGEYLGEIVHSVLNITDREFEIGTKLLITKKLEGYRSAEQFIFLDSEKSSVPLSDLEKSQNLALEFNWTYMQLTGLGTGVRYYPVADWMYVSFDTYFYVQKDLTSVSSSETIHNDLRILVGLYLGIGPDRIFRVSASLGAGVIFSYPIDRPGTYYDYYINAVNLSLELNLDRWSFYLRPELKIALGIGDNSLHEGGLILSEYNVPAITVGVLRKW